MRNVRVNRQAIKSLVNSIGSTKEFLWDLELPGFGVYKTKVGRPTFVYQFRSPVDKNVVRRETIARGSELTIEQARTHAADLAQQVRKGIDPVLARKQAEAERKAAEELFLCNYIEGYLRRRELRQDPVSAEVQAVYRTDILGQLGNLRLDQITYKQTEDAMSRLSARSQSAARWFITYLKVIINDAISRELMTKSPVLKVPVPQPAERDRVLTHVETQRFLEACHDMPDVRGDVYALLLRLLRRKEEVASLTWEEIDQHTWLWALPGTREKTNSSIRIPLPRQVVEMLERIQPDPALRTGLVFSLNGGNTPPDMGSKLRKHLNATMDRRIELAEKQSAGPRLVVPHFTIHDLRTSAATTMGEALGIQPHVIEVLLNHTLGTKMQRKYQRTTFQSAMGKALSDWNDYLDEVLAKSPSWPGGMKLPSMGNKEINHRHAFFTATWPKRVVVKTRDDAADGSE